MQSPTLRQLEYIVAVADTGRFIQAAKQCGVSQPALSKQVREVEDALGIKLFERVRPRVIVTPVGAELVTRARRILAESREMVEAARSFSGDRRGIIRLGVIPTVASYGLPGLVAKLRRIYPEASFAIRELQTERLVDCLRSGEIDLGLLARPFDNDHLQGANLVVEPFVLIAPTGHPLGATGPVGPHELVGASLILMEDGHCLRDQAIDVCTAAGKPPPTSVTAASVSTLVRMVESGLGATLIPASAIASEVRVGQGFVVRSFGQSPLRQASPGRTLTLQWRDTSPHADWFTEIGVVLREHYLDLNATCPKVAGPPPMIRAVEA